MTILLWQRGYYIVPIWDLPILCALPMKVKDGGFQHDENHANCRSKEKILWTSQLQLPCGPSCWNVSRWSFGRSPGIDSRIPAGSRLCDIRSIPGLQSYSSLPLQSTTESFLAKTLQHGALFGWYLIWSTLPARHSWALSFLKAEVQLFNRCIMAAVFCCS